MSKKYDYKVAISFAGEQRAIAEELAHCIEKGGGGPVFYDKDVKSTLWGKDLYEHLAEIYKDRAEFCVIIASKEYLERQWTVHERKSAQARALENKGTEYILPIDYDGTRLPGLHATVGYLKFADEGIAGICEAFLEKIGISKIKVIAPRLKPATSVSISTRAIIIAGKKVVFVPVVRSSWGSTVTLLLEPDDETDIPILNGIRQGTRPVVVAYQYNVAVCKVDQLTHLTESNKSRWELKLLVEQDNFQPDLEAGTSSISAAEFAEERARRLLLNENPARETEDMNEIFLEVLRRGQGTMSKIERSPFPELFKTLGNKPILFLESAWITAAMQLKLSSCVETIDVLRLELRDSYLAVTFTGTRHRKYVNVDPHVINIEGQCLLT
jgi:hypothetical protein